MNKKKIFNDPIYGLIRFQHEIIYEIIEHPYFQRLRRISQLGLSHYVYPGGLHTRFQHALGALHLMTRTIDTLRSKGITISDEEYEAVSIAILLHDVGHGPFSHALEHTLIDLHHEEISLTMIYKIGEDVKHDFSLAIKIFKGEYHRNFFHELVSGQIDVDRMDYLTRDSFFTGVAEGIIGYDRIIAMMNVVDDKLVIEEKGIYSVEKFLMARRLMYWQVYLHKTVVSAEVMLIAILERAKYLLNNGIEIASSDELNYFLKFEFGQNVSTGDESFLKNYALLDDMDILWTIKKSVNHQDFILRYLCSNILDRKLFKVSLHNENPANTDFEEVKERFAIKYKIPKNEMFYFFKQKSETIVFYDSLNKGIHIYLNSGAVVDFSDINVGYKNLAVESRVFNCYPDEF